MNATLRAPVAIEFHTNRRVPSIRRLWPRRDAKTTLAEHLNYLIGAIIRHAHACTRRGLPMLAAKWNVIADKLRMRQAEHFAYAADHPGWDRLLADIARSN